MLNIWAFFVNSVSDWAKSVGVASSSVLSMAADNADQAFHCGIHLPRLQYRVYYAA
jgi:hypothetical protein